VITPARPCALIRSGRQSTIKQLALLNPVFGNRTGVAP
jgi:hypothetical protein